MSNEQITATKVKTKLELATAEPAQTPLEVEEDEEQASNSRSISTSSERKSGHNNKNDAQEPHGVNDVDQVALTAADSTVASAVATVGALSEAAAQTQGETARADQVQMSTDQVVEEHRHSLFYKDTIDAGYKI